MNKTYRDWVPNQSYMFPPSPQDWLLEDDLRDRGDEGRHLASVEIRIIDDEKSALTRGFACGVSRSSHGPS